MRAETQKKLEETRSAAALEAWKEEHVAGGADQVHFLDMEDRASRGEGGARGGARRP